MKEVLIMCRERGVELESINRELFYGISLMMYKGSPQFWKGHSWYFNWWVFHLGLSLIDVNFVAYGLWNYGRWNLEGKTILSMVLENFRDNDDWVQGVSIVREVLKHEDLDLSLTNVNGKMALDFFIVYDNHNLRMISHYEDDVYYQPILTSDTCS